MMGEQFFGKTVCNEFNISSISTTGELNCAYTRNEKEKNETIGENIQSNTEMVLDYSLFNKTEELNTNLPL